MMKRIWQLRYASAFVSLLAAFAVYSFQARAEDLSGLAAALDEAARTAIEARETAGLQVAVYKDGAPLLVKGYGLANLEWNIPVTNDTVFRIGSITKQFPAVVLLLLQEEGKLSLDDKLAKYYPSFPRAADISLKQMLHHTSGLHNYTADKVFDERDQMLRQTTDEWVEYFARMPKTQDFEPGTSWNYSNTAYYLLGAIIEKVEGKPLAKVLEERLFKPLGMTRTALDDEYDVVPNRASGYGVDEQGQFINARFISMTAVGAAGAMRSTASDLMRWTPPYSAARCSSPNP
ncbi:MAG TPA: serine hydrolase domain-containing protein [Steroidobacter sp.]